MKLVVLERLETGDQGTFGRIVIGSVTLVTGELPWRENAPNISCIPSGKYRCVWTMSARFKRYLYLVAPVIGRSGIRMHAANLMGDASNGFQSQLNGCIALGEKLGSIGGQKAILLSVPAMRRFESMMNGRPFDLEIKPCSTF